jgi:hypothetical protein
LRCASGCTAPTAAATTSAAASGAALSALACALGLTAGGLFGVQRFMPRAAIICAIDDSSRCERTRTQKVAA